MTDNELSLLLKQRIDSVRSCIASACRRVGRDPQSVTLVAVTKSVSNRVAALLPSLGINDLGENRPQELWKKATIPGIRWHFIGHLQRNKIDKTVPLVTLLHSVDSERLLIALNEFGLKHSPVTVLIEVNCSDESAKGGFAPGSIPDLTGYNGLKIQGFMTMAAYDENPDSARSTFAMLRQIRDELRLQTGLPLPELSMGMSNDFEVAIEEGATLVRIGSTLFEGLEGE